MLIESIGNLLQTGRRKIAFRRSGGRFPGWTELVDPAFGVVGGLDTELARGRGSATEWSCLSAQSAVELAGLLVATGFSGSSEQFVVELWGLHPLSQRAAFGRSYRV
jgi:hypothetical protein